MASDQKFVNPWIDQLKLQLQKFGSDRRIEGALFCQKLDEAATKIAFAFPSIEKKVKYANIILAGNEAYEYEDDEHDQGENEDDTKEVNETPNVDALIVKQLENTKTTCHFRFAFLYFSWYCVHFPQLWIGLL